MVHLCGYSEVTQAVHELLDGPVPVIPMTIQNVDTTRPQPLEGGFDRQP